jgi:hypothetical protein
LEGNGGGAKLGFRAAAAEGRRRLTGGTHLSAAAGARAGGCSCGLGRPGPGGEREGFGPTFGPKPKEDFLKPFSI